MERQGYNRTPSTPVTDLERNSSQEDTKEHTIQKFQQTFFDETVIQAMNDFMANQGLQITRKSQSGN